MTREHGEAVGQAPGAGGRRSPWPRARQWRRWRHATIQIERKKGGEGGEIWGVRVYKGAQGLALILPGARGAGAGGGRGGEECRDRHVDGGGGVRGMVEGRRRWWVGWALGLAQCEE